MRLKAAAARRHTPQLSTVPLLALAVLAVAGCGSSSSNTSSAEGGHTTPTVAASTPSTATAPAPAGTAQTLNVAANPEGQLKFDTTALTAKAGAVTLDFTNMASLAHNLTVADSSGNVLGATPTFEGGSKTLALTLKPGVYKFYCSVPGHRMAGMEGTLTVQ